MKLPHYRVDAFADRVFAGNPAGVCPLREWLPEETLARIAAEINLPATAFFVRQPDDYAIRWFTPVVEEELRGHATLVAAFVILNFLGSARGGALWCEDRGSRARLSCYLKGEIIL